MGFFVDRTISFSFCLASSQLFFAVRILAQTSCRLVVFLQLFVAVRFPEQLNCCLLVSSQLFFADYFLQQLKCFFPAHGRCGARMCIDLFSGAVFPTYSVRAPCSEVLFSFFSCFWALKRAGRLRSVFLTLRLSAWSATSNRQVRTSHMPRSLTTRSGGHVMTNTYNGRMLQVAL